MSDNKLNKYFWPQDLINWLELLVKLVLITGALGAIYQYFDVKQEKRIKETIEQVKALNSGDLNKAQLKLVTTWDKHHNKLNDELFIISTIEKENLNQEIELLISFFNDLQSCIHYEICDACSAQSFLKSSARSFYNLYRPWLKEQEKTRPNYSSRLEEFVNNGAKCS